ncbi:hypothetical protein LX69_02665 [Breznakibacter xylanolyticus]|uniref:Uncharacterized protein n=1 Tax=Breznakibacter xylanolyticus TaxID=990 RepID=A0A2W7PV70_9BACT|nr:hypothetical protein LX69_02665 [Breznakibacter xylanolyticus]
MMKYTYPGKTKFSFLTTKDTSADNSTGVAVDQLNIKASPILIFVRIPCTY